MSNSGKWGWIAAAGLITLAGGYCAWINRRLLLVHDITTGESAAYPELRSRVYYTEPGKALTAAEQSLRRLPGWKFISRDAENDAIEAEVRTSFGLLTDDVTLYAMPLGHGQTRVTLRARSRLGGGDLGRNAAHIRALQQAMDLRMNTDAAFGA